MALSLDSISSNVTLAPPRIVLHGPHGVGKTTFGACAPSPILLPVEDGLGKLEVPHFPRLGSFAEVCEAIDVLLNDTHDFATAVVDTLDWLEPMVWERTCADNEWDNIEGPGYGKGYLAADETWRVFLDRCQALRDQRGMAVILLAHSEIRRFDPPDTEPYDRYQPKLHKRGAALIEEWADTVLFANYRTFVTTTESGFNKKTYRGVGTGERVLHTEERPAHRAKNRYGLPPELTLDWQAFEAALAAPTHNPTQQPTEQEAA